MKETASRILAELSPDFPLPAPGDQVLVRVFCVIGRPGWRAWCPVTAVRTGPADLYPVEVTCPCGTPESYQQGEIEGWAPC